MPRLRIPAVGAVAFALIVTGSAAARDSLIAQMATDVDRLRVESVIQQLEGYGTRYSFTSQCDAAADWLHVQLQAYGLAVSFENFIHSGQPMRNVIGRLDGTVYPDRVFIVSAHYDSTSNDPLNDAPGADDNASGVAAVLEAARILSAYEFENTIEFVLLSAEEQGLVGSAVNASNAVTSGKDIIGVVNLDMIGFWPTSHDQELDIGKNGPSAWLADILEQATLNYSTIVPHNWPDTGVCNDDHVSYWNAGFDAIILMDCYEAHAVPASGERTQHYHRTTDTLATLDLDLTTEAVRATVGGMAELAVPVIGPVTLFAVKASGPDDVNLSWLGGAINFDVDSSTSKDFTTGVNRLTPVDGITVPDWSDIGVLGNGVTYFYNVSRH